MTPKPTAGPAAARPGTSSPSTGTVRSSGGEDDGFEDEPEPAAPARVSRVRVEQTKGQAKAVRFSLSTAGTVTVRAARRSASGRFGSPRSRTFTLQAGEQRLTARGARAGLGLARGSWKVTVTGQAGQGTVTISVR